MADSLSLQAEAQLKLRVRREKETLKKRYDWYGPPCGCLIPAGDCKEHPVEHCGCEGVKAGKCPDHPVDSCGCLQPLGGCSLHHRARPEQRPPEGEWRQWVYCGGRAGGKTRAAAEYVTWCVENRKVRLIALVGESVKDVRTVMIEGPSGLASPSVARPWLRVDYEPSKAQVRWYDKATNEEIAVATIYSAENPDQLRGPQYHLVWLDELAKYRHRQQETWDQVQFGLRLKTDPQPRAIITTTPQPTPTFKSILKNKRTALTTGTTFDNAAQLDEAYLETMKEMYEGTRLGRQELYAHLLDDTVGALFSLDMIRYQPVHWVE